MGLGYSKETIQALANIINCRSRRWPITYLVLPIGAKPRSKALWDPLIENLKKGFLHGKGSIYLLAGESPLLKPACLIF